MNNRHFYFGLAFWAACIVADVGFGYTELSAFLSGMSTVLLFQAFWRA